jgi:alkane 1-monooxygenase
VAHEIGHAKDGWKRAGTRVLLACHCYGMWRAEHNRAHHVKAATPEDTVFSPKNESIYKFMPKAILGSYVSGVKAEAEAIRRKGLNPWNPKHIEVMRIFAGTGLFLIASYALAGWMGVAFFLFQGFVSIQVLESVQYVQHYGLLRKKGADGTYERMAPRHSWNSGHVFGNYMTLNLIRHSDHHANPSLRYHELRSCQDAPQLLSGYPGMIALALVPPLWFKVMNPRLEKYLEEQDGAPDTSDVDKDSRMPVNV